MSKWTMGRTLARSNYFKSVPQKVPLMTTEHKRKREAWCNAHQIYNFDNVIFTDESRFQFYRMMYSVKVGKIWTLSKNGAEVLTSCYSVGWNKQVWFNSTCFCEWKYISNQVL